MGSTLTHLCLWEHSVVGNRTIVLSSVVRSRSAGQREGVPGAAKDDGCKSDGVGRPSTIPAWRTSEPAADSATKSGSELARHKIVEDRVCCRAEVVQNAYTRSFSQHSVLLQV